MGAGRALTCDFLPDHRAGLDAWHGRSSFARRCYLLQYVVPHARFVPVILHFFSPLGREQWDLCERPFIHDSPPSTTKSPPCVRNLNPPMTPKSAHFPARQVNRRARCSWLASHPHPRL